MDKWDYMDTAYTQEEAAIVKNRMEKTGYQVKFVLRNTAGEMPCIDIYTKADNGVG